MTILSLYASTELIKANAKFTIDNINCGDFLDIPRRVMYKEIELVTINRDGSHVYIHTVQEV